jgi:hypothetical protein
MSFWPFSKSSSKSSSKIESGSSVSADFDPFEEKREKMKTIEKQRQQEEIQRRRRKLEEKKLQQTLKKLIDLKKQLETDNKPNEFKNIPAHLMIFQIDQQIDDLNKQIAKLAFGRRRRKSRKSKRKSHKSRRHSRRRKSIGGCRIKRKPRGSRQKTYFTNKSGVEYVKVNPRCGVRRRRRSRRFGYSHDQGPHMYNAHYSDGILLADNAFSWMGNPEARSENA